MHLLALRRGRGQKKGRRPAVIQEATILMRRAAFVAEAAQHVKTSGKAAVLRSSGALLRDGRFDAGS
jgi:hypothetical protein